MNNQLKKRIPYKLKNWLRLFLNFIDSSLLNLFKHNSFSAALYYTFISNKFNREHTAIIAGKLAYKKHLKLIGKSSPLLRRNIHRLEKGLIMRPRRTIFAENYIQDTVLIFNKVSLNGKLETEEIKWARDVLVEYFNAAEKTKIIKAAEKIFLQNKPKTENENTFTPYPHSALPSSKINFEELKRLFQQRRSVRWYQNKEVSENIIKKAIDIASLAPSACNRQPFYFYVSKDKTEAVKIAECAGGTAGWAENIPCTIVIVGDLSAYPLERDRHLIYIDGSLAAMQLMLAFTSLGISTCPINWPDVAKAERKMERLLLLKKYERPIMLLSVGYGLDEGGIPYSQKKDNHDLIKMKK